LPVALVPAPTAVELVLAALAFCPQATPLVPVAVCPGVVVKVLPLMQKKFAACAGVVVKLVAVKAMPSTPAP